MFGPASYKDAPIELCYSNCPRIFPRREELILAAGESAAATGIGKPVPDEYQTDAGTRLYPDRAKPCYLLFRLTRPHCRALRNFIVTNKTKLAVVNGQYCGIATKVFNLKAGNMESTLSLGLLKFSSTHQAFRFATDEHRMASSTFLGGRFDVWNLTMCSPDRCTVPNPMYPNKFVNLLNAFHFVHIKSLALVQDGAEMSPAARESALATCAEIQARLEACLDSLERHGGRLVVKATTAARIRGLPHHSPVGEPGHAVYMSQWPGVYHFWQWMEGPEGLKFDQTLVELTGSNYESFLFTACLDFIDLE